MAVSDGEKRFYDIETRISWMLKKKPEKKSKWYKSLELLLQQSA